MKDFADTHDKRSMNEQEGKADTGFFDSGWEFEKLNRLLTAPGEIEGIVEDVRISHCEGVKDDLKPSHKEIERIISSIKEKIAEEKKKEAAKDQPMTEKRLITVEKELLHFAQEYCGQEIERILVRNAAKKKRAKTSRWISILAGLAVIAAVVYFMLPKTVKDYGLTPANVKAQAFSAQINLADNKESCIINYVPSGLGSVADPMQAECKGLQVEISPLIPNVEYAFSIAEPGEAANAACTKLMEAYSGAPAMKWISTLYQHKAADGDALVDLSRCAIAENIALSDLKTGDMENGYQLIAVQAGMDAIDFAPDAQVLVAICRENNVTLAVGEEKQWQDLYSQEGQFLHVQLSALLRRVRQYQNIWNAQDGGKANINTLQVFVDGNLILEQKLEFVFS